MIAPWHSTEKPPEVRGLSEPELIELWTQNANNHLGLVAAYEVMRRLKAQQEMRKTT
jgi:hypothetical protein